MITMDEAAMKLAELMEAANAEVDRLDKAHKERCEKPIGGSLHEILSEHRARESIYGEARAAIGYARGLQEAASLFLQVKRHG